MNKKRVLDYAVILFAKYGIKTVSMDNIATNLKISKKTLYEIFTDKEDLLNKCLHNEMLRVLTFSRQMEKYSESPLEKLIIQSAISYEYVAGYCPAFYKDLERYVSTCEIINSHVKSFIEKQRLILEDGIRHGYLDPDLNTDIIIKAFRNQLIRIKKTFVEERMPTDDLMYMLTAILKGVCTENGVSELERIRIKWTNSNMMEKLTIRSNI